MSLSALVPEHRSIVYSFLTPDNIHVLQTTCWNEFQQYNAERLREWQSIQKMGVTLTLTNLPSPHVCAHLVRQCHSWFQLAHVSSDVPLAQSSLRNLGLQKKIHSQIDRVVTSYLRLCHSSKSQFNPIPLFASSMKHFLELSSQAEETAAQAMAVPLNTFYTRLHEKDYVEAGKALFALRDDENIQEKWQLVLPNLQRTPEGIAIRNQITDPEVIRTLFEDRIVQMVQGQDWNEHLFNLWKEILSSTLPQREKNNLSEWIIYYLGCELFRHIKNPQDEQEIITKIQSKIVSPHLQDRVLKEIVHNCVQNRPLSMAKRMARSIQNPNIKNELFELICRKYIKGFQWNKAENTIDEMAESPLRSTLYQELSRQYLLRDDFTGAIRIARKILDPQIQATYYGELCKALSCAGLIDEAIELADQIIKLSRKYMILQSLATTPRVEELLQRYAQEINLTSFQHHKERCLSLVMAGHVQEVAELVNSVNHYEMQILLLCDAIQQVPVHPHTLSHQIFYLNHAIAKANKPEDAIEGCITEKLAQTLISLHQIKGLEFIIPFIKQINHPRYQDLLINRLTSFLRHQPQEVLELIRFMNSDEQQDQAYFKSLQYVMQTKNFDFAEKFCDEINDIQRQSTAYRMMAISLFPHNDLKSCTIALKILDPKILSDTYSDLCDKYLIYNNFQKAFSLAKQIPLWEMKCRVVSKLIQGWLAKCPVKKDHEYNQRIIQSALKMYQVIDQFIYIQPVMRAFNAIRERANHINFSSDYYQTLLEKPPIAPEEGEDEEDDDEVLEGEL